MTARTPQPAEDAARTQQVARIVDNLAHAYDDRFTVLAAVDVVVLVGCGDECPVLPGRRYEDWPVTDPAGAAPAHVAAIRADLDARVRELAANLLPGVALPAPLPSPLARA